jgi:hypothetical protein
MHWKTKHAGDRRVRIVFALIPRECVDGQSRWLQRIAVEEEYVICRGRGWWFERKVCAAYQLCSCREIGCEEFKTRGIAAHIFMASAALQRKTSDEARPRAESGCNKRPLNTWRPQRPQAVVERSDKNKWTSILKSLGWTSLPRISLPSPKRFRIAPSTALWSPARR